MADNYLERRMDDYRSGRLASRSHSTPSMRAVKRPDTLTLTYPPLRVAVFAAGLTPVAGETVKALASAGCTIDFTSADTKASTELAQRTGARFYPAATVSPDSMIEDIIARRDGIDVAVVFGGMAGKSSPLPAARVIDADALPVSQEAAPETVARFILYLVHPDNAGLL